MQSKIKRFSSLLLLAGVVSPVLTAHAQSDDEKMAQLERLVQNSNQVQLRMQKQLDSQSTELTKLRGQVEEYSYKVKQITERQRQLFIELDNLKSNSSAKNDLGDSATSSESSASSANFSSDSEEESYKAAVALILKQKDYPGAIKAFKSFQTQYPDSDYIPNSHYWLGQLYFSQNQDVDAAKSFGAVVSYQDSSKRADALVKLGDIAKRNSNIPAAKKYYQKAVDEYPGTSSAGLATQALANL